MTAPAGTPINGGAHTIPPAIGGKVFHPFGDFLLHDIGTGDGIAIAVPEHYGVRFTRFTWQAFSMDSLLGSRNKVRTAPLWGVRLRPRLLHDGSSLTLRDAILRHKQEASDATDRFLRLTPSEQAAIIEFLRSL
jgi:cytochrome c peroxidase